MNFPMVRNGCETFYGLVATKAVLMLCGPSKRWRPFSYHTVHRVFLVFVRVLVAKIGINSEKCIEYGK